MVLTVVGCCVVAAAIKREYGTWRRNVIVVLSGVATSNVKFVKSKRKSTFAIKDINSFAFSTVFSTEDFFSFEGKKISKKMRNSSVSLENGNEFSNHFSLEM